MIEKWRNENATDEQILKELLFILNMSKNGIDLFTSKSVDEKQQIKIGRAHV